MKYRVERRLKRNGVRYELGDTIDLTKKDETETERLLARGVISRPGNSPASSGGGENGGERSSDPAGAGEGAGEGADGGDASGAGAAGSDEAGGAARSGLIA